MKLWITGLDGELKTFDINSATDNSVGQHDNAIRCVEFSNDVNAVRLLQYIKSLYEYILKPFYLILEYIS